MDRLDARPDDSAYGTPDMTALEAADAMERAHGSRLVVRQGTRFVGVLTERDIVEKVLAAGRRPDLVRVADIMSAGWQRADGTLLLEAEEAPPEWDDDLIRETLQGKCEECGCLDPDLVESDGLLVCPDCARSVFGIYA